MRELSREQKGWKALTRYLVDLCGGSTFASTLLGGKSASLISCYGNPDDPNENPRWITLADIVALERYAGRSVIGAWLVDQAKADPDRVRRRRIDERDVLRLAKEGSESKLAIIAAHDRRHADGTFGAADRAAVARELRELGALVAELLEAVEEGA